MILGALGLGVTLGLALAEAERCEERQGRQGQQGLAQAMRRGPGSHVPGGGDAAGAPVRSAEQRQARRAQVVGTPACPDVGPDQVVDEVVQEQREERRRTQRGPPVERRCREQDRLGQLDQQGPRPVAVAPSEKHRALATGLEGRGRQPHAPCFDIEITNDR